VRGYREGWCEEGERGRGRGDREGVGRGGRQCEGV